MSEQFIIENKSKYQGKIHLVAISLFDQKIVGQTIAFSTGRTADIFDFHVKQKARLQGVGSLLLDELEKIALEQGNSRLVRIGLFCDEESIPGFFAARNFFKKRGFADRIIFLSKKLKK